MNNYGVVLTSGEVLLVEAYCFDFREGFIIFLSKGCIEIVAAYNQSHVESVTKQKRFTEEEILSEIGGAANETTKQDN
jgi:hypothetical protein